jgi:hypothetical protein
MRKFSRSLKKRAHRHGSYVFVAATPPKPPICALKLGDRSSTSGVPRGLSAGLRHACSVSAAASPVELERGARAVSRKGGTSLEV